MSVIIHLATGFWGTLAAMAPYLLFGFLVAGFLSVLVPPSLVERHLGGRGLWPVVKSSLFGVPLPLCSCGVIPVAASLRRHGATRGATTAFLLSTPQTGVDSILVTYSLLGPVLAVFRPVAAFLTGLIGGAAVTYLDTGGAGSANGDNGGDNCQGACCVRDPKASRFVAALKYGFVTLPQDIGRALVIGILVAAFIGLVVPDDFFAGVLGTGFVGMLVMMALGIPVYVCATASVPVAAALVAKGVSPGAALVFLMTGPATNAVSIATIWKIMGRRTAVIYLATVACASLGAGALFDALFPATVVSSHVHAMRMGPALYESLAGVALLAVLGYAMWRSWRGAGGPREADLGMTTVMNITGMHCSHCAAAVERALGECAGVEKVTVDLGSGTAIVTGEGLDKDLLRGKVTGLGYTVGDVTETKRGTAEKH